MGGLTSKELLPFPVVDTKYGKIEGKKIFLKKKRIANVFLGVPFAKPPIGELRFKKPEPPNPWNSVLQCKKYKNISVQKQLPINYFKASEDCLYLNVITPNWKTEDEKGFPVMMYVHGGGFVMDSPANYNYKKLGRTLVRHGVIVVTICYRLGLLGYFCTSDDTAVGNYGVWDQYFALKFVHENIAAFGGDPSNITVFGQSAGAVSSDLLSILPISRNLVSKVALLGGNCEAIWAVSTRKIAAKNCQELAIKLGFKKTDNDWNSEENKRLLEFLRKLPSRKLGMSMYGVSSIYDKMRLPVGPVVDADIIPVPPHILRQETPPRPILAGNAKHEGLVFLALGMKCMNDRLVTEMEEKFHKMNAIVSKIHGPDEVLPMEEIYEAYNVTRETIRKRKHREQAVVGMIDDIISNFALYNFAMNERKKGSKVWIYYFEHHNPMITFGLKMFFPFNEATHGSELAYLLDVSLFLTPYIKTKKDVQVINLITKLFTNFAKFGDPNGSTISKTTDSPLNFVWEPVSTEFPEKHLIILPNPYQKNCFDTQRIEKFANFYSKLNRYFCDEKIAEKFKTILPT